MTAAERLSPEFSRATTASWNSLRLSATTEFSTKTAEATFCEEPTARNSKRLPVNAKGEVLFLSVLSGKISGMELTIFMDSKELASGSFTAPIFNIDSKTPYSVEPENTDITAGGASPPPRRYELLSDATVVMRR